MTVLIAAGPVLHGNILGIVISNNACDVASLIYNTHQNQRKRQSNGSFKMNPVVICNHNDVCDVALICIYVEQSPLDWSALEIADKPYTFMTNIRTITQFFIIEK